MHFQREVDYLNQHLVAIAKRVEDQVNMAFNSALQMDVETARKVIDGDAEVDNVEVMMEEECLKLLALYQPVANDLRLIVAVLKINNDLERIGDHAKNMAQIVVSMAEGEPLKISDRMITIFDKTKLMLRKALLAFTELDRELAESVLAMDDEVDSMCKAELPLQIDMIKSEPDLTGQHLMLLSVCRQLERIGDHASNIAEDIIYLLSGEIIRHSISGSLTRAPSC